MKCRGTPTWQQAAGWAGIDLAQATAEDTSEHQRGHLEKTLFHSTSHTTEYVIATWELLVKFRTKKRMLGYLRRINLSFCPFLLWFHPCTLSLLNLSRWYPEHWQELQCLGEQWGRNYSWGMERLGHICLGLTLLLKGKVRVKMHNKI